MPSDIRRKILQCTFGSVAGYAAQTLWPGGVRAQPQSAVVTERLAGGLFLLTAGATNVVAQTDAEGVLLVDGPSAAAADGLEAALAALPGAGPVHTLFNTHWHPEHTGLNERLGLAGARIVAQENTRLWMTTDITYPWDGSHFEPLPEIGQPNTSFYDEGELDSGVRYGHLRHAGHTDGDIYVYFPEANLLAVGDAASGAGWPLIDWWTGGWIGGVVGTMEMLLALTDAETRIVPARGRVLTRADIEAQFEMYNVIYERLAEMLNRGRGPDEAVEARPTADYDALMGPSESFVRRAFESLWAYLSPDA